ncbi:hypothetical protein ACG04R_18430 [Roseateles sp. BYS78W]|uniref:7TM-DISM receptor extracellular domain-containing protein n=1 Tax=Pelomonas candidula TaxID=3299025 RepID=A0ABW7HFJ4_9BURK
MNLWRWLWIWLALCTGSVLAAPSAPAASFDDALAATRLGERPAGAFFLVELLASQGQAGRAEQLRRTLWRLQSERLQGAAAAAPLTVGQAIAQGAGEPADTAVLWLAAYNAALQVRWPDAASSAADLRVTLLNRSPDPLPLAELRLRFGSESGGVTLPCATEPAPPDVHAAWRQTVAAGAQVEVLCQPPADARSQSLLPVLLAAARGGGEAPTLLPAAPAGAGKRGDHWLWQFWGRVEEPLNAWQRRWAQARLPENAGRAWQAATWPEPPELQPLPPTLAQRIVGRGREVADRAALLLWMAGGAWALILLMRLAMRDASLQVQSRLCLALALGSALAFLMATRRGQLGSGDGWSRWGEWGVWLGVLSLAFGAAMLAGLMLRLFRLLDEERRSWWQAIADGWRRALHIGGLTTRGQFWGFMAFALWAWALVSPWGRPWNRLALVALLVPLVTLCIRRLTSLTPREFWALLAVVAVLVLEHWL